MPAPTAITVYTRPSCGPCMGTMRHLDKGGVAYQKVSTTESVEVADALKALGYMQAPVVVVRPAGSTEDIHWSGFRPDMLDQFCINPSKEVAA